MEPITLAMIPAHRGVMDRNFSIDRRARLLAALSGIGGVRIVAPTESVTSGGLVSGEKDALRAIDHFEKERPAGIVLAVLGYGDEKSALAIVEKFPGLPVLLVAMKEPVPNGGFLQGASVGGMLPISYGLRKRNRPFTFAGVFEPDDPRLAAEVASFARVCHAVRKFRGARVGMIGFRPYDFEVCIFNEGLLLERYGAKTVPLNLIDLEHAITGIADSDPLVGRIVEEIRAAFSPGLRHGGARAPCEAGARHAPLRRGVPPGRADHPVLVGHPGADRDHPVPHERKDLDARDPGCL